MATTFLEPGGDSTFNVALTTAGGFWGFISSTPSVATDFVHGSHIKSIKYNASSVQQVCTPNSTLADAGSRVSFWIYLNVLPSSTNNFFLLTNSAGGTQLVTLRLTTAGILQMTDGKVSPTQIGSNGPTLSTGNWYRISFAYTITNSSTNRFEVKVFDSSGTNQLGSISVTNASINTTGSSSITIGNVGFDSALDMRSSDHYIDNSSSLTDPGNIWVTAKRPNANGTTNGFTTQIGSGGSGYGTGHSPQVNERALNNANGWSIVVVASAITEEYNIESKSTGDIDISLNTIVDYMGWVDCKAVLSETGQIIVNNVTTNISIPANAETLFTQAAGSTTYPAGTGTDIGIVTSATATTVSLYECGIMVAYKPFVSNVNDLLMMFR